jgi:hypothetical protein
VDDDFVKQAKDVECGQLELLFEADIIGCGVIGMDACKGSVGGQISRVCSHSSA